MLRFLTAGESHGPGLVTIVEGLPKGILVSSSDFADELRRRRYGHGRGARMQIEADDLEILAGVRHGATMGSPVAVMIRNTEWTNWSSVMSVDPGEAKMVTRPRPGHADLPGMLKYDTEDARDVLERASARETAARTIAGVLAKALLRTVEIEILSHVVAIGEVAYEGPGPMRGQQSRIDESPVRCLDPFTSDRMVAVIDAATEAKDTLGGVFEVSAHGVPAGVGSYVHYDRRLDGLLAQAVMSIPGVKAVEIGDGFAVSGEPGSSSHDEILIGDNGLTRASNRAGGMEGGMANGEEIRIRGAMKPISTLMRPLRTVDMATGEPAVAVRERSDVCAVPAAGVVGEQMVAFVIAAEMVRMFGGDTVGDFVSSVGRYRARIDARPT